MAVAFMERFDNQPYLFENIHLYSLKVFYTSLTDLLYFSCGFCGRCDKNMEKGL